MTTGVSRATRTSLALLLGLACAGCPPAGSPDEPSVGGTSDASPLVVFTVNYPLAYFAERIGGDLVRVELPAPEDGDPAFWSPDAETIVAYQEADLILLNGAGYAGWTTRATLPSSKLVDTSAGFRDRYLVVEDAATHTHGPEGEHAHGTVAFNTWLDPMLALEQARAIRDALQRARPDSSERLNAGMAALELDLLRLDESLAEAAGRFRGQPIVASHPVYQYLAARYDLDLHSVHLEPGEDPGPAGWRDLSDLLGRYPARFMLWEGEPLDETRRRLEQAGLTVAVYELCGNRPRDGDWLSVMQNNVADFARVAAGR